MRRACQRGRARTLAGSALIGRRELMVLLGGAAAWPLAMRAQQIALPVIGFLHPQDATAAAQVVDEFRGGLAMTGFVEGRNVAIEYRWAQGREDRLAALAADLVGHRVAAIAAPGGDSSAFAIKAATTTIPVVSLFASDPVRNGFIAALTHPSGNFTGVYRFGTELEPKRLEILSEVAPKVATIDLLVNPDAANTPAGTGDVETAARRLDRRIRQHEARSDAEIDAVFATLSRLRAGALQIMADSYFAGQSRHIGELASRYGIPAIYATREFASAGGLMSYTVDETDAVRQVGIYTGRVLKGERPANMPVQQSARIELTVNLKAAKALGIAIPSELLAGAAEVIQ